MLASPVKRYGIIPPCRFSRLIRLYSDGWRMEEELISIGMPIFNADKFLEGAIQSLLAQTHFNFELLISDNGSQDRTQEICLYYANREPRISYYRSASNQGVIWNFNYVLSLAKGDFFLWAAYDDRWHRDFLKECLAVLIENEDAVSVFCNYNVVNLQTGLAQQPLTPSAISSDASFKRLLSLILEPCPSMIYGLHRRNILCREVLQKFDYADLFLLANLVLQNKLLVVPRYLYSAGVDGVRVPYSINGKQIRSRYFIFRMSSFFLKNFGFVKSLLLILVLVLRFGYAKLLSIGKKV